MESSLCILQYIYIVIACATCTSERTLHIMFLALHLSDGLLLMDSRVWVCVCTEYEGHHCGIYNIPYILMHGKRKSLNNGNLLPQRCRRHLDT